MTLYDALFIFIIGAAFGSFIAVLYKRIPRNKNLFQASHCDSCGKKLDWISLIPIVSYIIQLGKCKNCQKKIPVEYLLFELVGGFLAIAIYNKSTSILQFAILILFWALMLLNAMFDFRYKWFNSKILLACLFLSIINAILFNKDNLEQAFIGFFAFCGFFYYIRFIYSTIRQQETLGEGDVTIIGIVALILLWQDTIIAILLSSIIAAIVLIICSLFKRNKISEGIYYGFFIVLTSFAIWTFPEIASFIYNFNFNIEKIFLSLV